MSRKKEICFDLDRLVIPPADLCIVRLADVGIPARRELSRQSSEGLVSECGQIVVDGKLIKEDGLFAVERTVAVSRLIDAGVLWDQGVGIPERVGEHGGWEDCQGLRRLASIGGRKRIVLHLLRLMQLM